MGRSIAELIVSEEEQIVLQCWARRPKTDQALALRSRIVLACATGKSNTDVADALGISKPTVGKWRPQFVDHRLDGLQDEPRPTEWLLVALMCGDFEIIRSCPEAR